MIVLTARSPISRPARAVQHPLVAPNSLVVEILGPQTKALPSIKARMASTLADGAISNGSRTATGSGQVPATPPRFRTPTANLGKVLEGTGSKTTEAIGCTSPRVSSRSLQMEPPCSSHSNTGRKIRQVAGYRTTMAGGTRALREAGPSSAEILLLKDKVAFRDRSAAADSKVSVSLARSLRIQRTRTRSRHARSRQIRTRQILTRYQTRIHCRRIQTRRTRIQQTQTWSLHARSRRIRTRQNLIRCRTRIRSPQASVRRASSLAV